MKKYWVSWYSPENEGFEIGWPWWISGYRMDDNARTVVAAIKALCEEDVWQYVADSYDNSDVYIEQRFCEELMEDSPFSDRFPEADWMCWPDHADTPTRRVKYSTTRNSV